MSESYRKTKGIMTRLGNGELTIEAARRLMLESGEIGEEIVDELIGLALGETDLIEVEEHEETSNDSGRR